MTGLLARLAPFWLLGLLLLIAAATGLWLRGASPYDGLAFGLVEQTHLAVGWICVPVLVVYQVHHLAVRWGPLRTRQRLLGIALTAALLLVIGTGAALTWVRGEAPGWIQPTHLALTLAITALLLWHSKPAWTRWFSRSES